MTLELGIKSDPVEYRYSYPWLFGLLEELHVRHLQLGSSFEFYQLPDDFFTDLRDQADRHGVAITSCFTAHRELGGFFSGDERLVAVARRNYERWIEIGGILGSWYVGSNPGAVFRDRPGSKEAGIALFLYHLNELQSIASSHGLRGLCVEPMSSMAEPPSSPEEVSRFARVTREHHRAHPETTTPVYFCGDISHALVAPDESIAYSHWELFELEIPSMAEFHFKNTDSVYSSTFGFEPANAPRGIVSLHELREILARRSGDFPVDTVVGYLEIGGPKLGRDYSDHKLKDQLVESIAAIRDVFPET